jgi:hypothetical protein
MGDYKTVGWTDDEQGQYGNYQEPGILDEEQTLIEKAARRDENRPVVKPFTLEPKAAPAIAVLNAKTAP